MPFATVALWAALAAGPAAQPAVAELRAEAERILGDWRDGRLAESYARFSAALRQKVTPAQLGAALDAIRKQMGDYVALAEPRVSDGDRMDDRPVVVLEARLRFADGSADARFHFVEEKGEWRLRHLKLEVPPDRQPRADDAAVSGFARELMDDVVRDGLPSLLSRYLPGVREQIGEKTLREVFERTARILGPMRSYELGAPVALAKDEECRQVEGRGRFEHGEGPLAMAFCPDVGVWRLIAFYVVPDMTPPIFERTAFVVVAEFLGRTDFELRCPAERVPVGGEVSCQFSSRGKRSALRVQRTGDDTVEVTGIPLE